jgi:hypothetical protein
MLTTPVETIVRQNLTLIAHDGTLNAESSVANGSEIRVTLLWRGTGVLPDLTLLDTDGRWSVDVPPLITVHDSITLDWRSVRVPADAPSGLAELRLLNGTVIGHYTIESLPMTLEAPAFNHSVAVEFPGVGELVGYSLSDPITLDVPPTLTLIWRAGESPSDVSYTVFAQLLNTEGRVIAQSDSIPKTGTRPTTGWRTGEYIEDAHMLIYNDLAAPGEAALIVGLYDTTNNQRLRLAENTDYVVLSDEVEVR